MLGRARQRGWTTAGLLAALAAPVAACGGDGPDVREPLGAHIVGDTPPVFAARAAGQAAVIPATASLPRASYTAEQAARGARVYQATCARCHPPGAFDGEAFAIAWNEARASTLFSTLRNTMPQDRPGSLSDEEYAAVVAHLLQRNGVGAGAVPLPPDTAALRGLRIDVTPTHRPAPER